MLVFGTNLLLSGLGILYYLCNDFKFVANDVPTHIIIT